MTECEGCKKLQGLCRTQWRLGHDLGSNTKKAELQQAYKAIEDIKKQVSNFQKEFTEALEEAEARAEYWEMKYNSVT